MIATAVIYFTSTNILRLLGAEGATIIGQGVTAVIAITYALCNKKFYVHVEMQNVKKICGSIFKVGLAPFGLALTPNIPLVLINRFSAFYGGEKAIATYACVSYIICIIYLILQGVVAVAVKLRNGCLSDSISRNFSLFIFLVCFSKTDSTAWNKAFWKF